MGTFEEIFAGALPLASAPQADGATRHEAAVPTTFEGQVGGGVGSVDLGGNYGHKLATPCKNFAGSLSGPALPGLRLSLTMGQWQYLCITVSIVKIDHT